MSLTDAYRSADEFQSKREVSPPSPNASRPPFATCRKHYVLKSETVKALRGVSFDVPEGDYVAIMGPSGSGKSTLLNLLGCLDKPTSGSLLLGEDDIASMTDDELAEIRSQRIGFVFQSYNLIQQLTVVENIQVPLYYQGNIGAKQQQRSIELARTRRLGRSARPPSDPAFRGTATACRDRSITGQRPVFCARR